MRIASNASVAREGAGGNELSPDWRKKIPLSFDMEARLKKAERLPDEEMAPSRATAGYFLRKMKSGRPHRSYSPLVYAIMSESPRRNSSDEQAREGDTDRKVLADFPEPKCFRIRSRVSNPLLRCNRGWAAERWLGCARRSGLRSDSF